MNTLNDNINNTKSILAYCKDSFTSRTPLIIKIIPICIFYQNVVV